MFAAADDPNFLTRLFCWPHAPALVNC